MVANTLTTPRDEDRFAGTLDPGAMAIVGYIKLEELVFTSPLTVKESSPCPVREKTGRQPRQARLHLLEIRPEAESESDIETDNLEWRIPEGAPQSQELPER
jgi:hypothetical protein